MTTTPEEFDREWERVGEFMDSIPEEILKQHDYADLCAIYAMASPEKQAIMRRRVKAGLNSLPAEEQPEAGAQS